MSKNNISESDKKNRDFVMFYRPFMFAIGNMASENSAAFRVFQLLTQEMDGYNAIMVSSQAISEIVGYSRQTVSNAVKYLKQNGWIDVYKSGSSNVYIINPDVAWTSYSNQREYCKFNGTFLIAQSENVNFLKNPKASQRYKGIDSSFVREVMKKRKPADDKEQLPGQMDINDFLPTGTEQN